uniref:Uncharacterized protein n=1 Tax=Stegastes partitus TaxID=144197 RepID=A0A3B5AIS7_9TELE
MRLTEQVDQEPHGTDPGDHLRGLDLVGFGEPLDSLQDDGEAQRREEDGVDQSPHHLRPDPAEGVFVGRVGLLGESHRDQSDHQRHPTDHHFHNEKPKNAIEICRKKSYGPLGSNYHHHDHQ